MRDNPETYEVFFTWFIPAIGRKTYWKHIVANAENDDDITTISNEALINMTLYNDTKDQGRPSLICFDANANYHTPMYCNKIYGQQTVP